MISEWGVTPLSRVPGPDLPSPRMISEWGVTLLLDHTWLLALWKAHALKLLPPLPPKKQQL